MYYEADMSYPDDFDSRAFDIRWSDDDETVAKGAISDLSFLLKMVRGIPRNNACEDALNGLEDAFNDAIGEIERSRA